MKKKFVSKLIACGLIATMAASLVAGCGSKDNSDKTSKKDDAEKVLKVAAFQGGFGGEIWEKLADAFEEEKGVKVELHLSSELDKDLTKDFKNKNIPDVVYYSLGQPSGFTETMLKEEAIADISDVFTDELKEKLLGGITESAVAQPYGDGKIYLAPFKYEPVGLWYNKDLFEGENKKYDLPTTWNEFFALGDKAKADGISLFTYPTSGYFDCVLRQMYAQAGGYDFFLKATNYDKDTWTSDEGKEIIDALAKVTSKDYLFPDTVANANAKGGHVLNQQSVVDGKTLFCPDGSWIMAENANTTPEGFNWGMTALPKFDASDENYVYTFTEQVWVPADAPNMDLAKEFISFMYSEKAANLMVENTIENKETGERVPSAMVSPLLGTADKLPEGAVKDSFTLLAKDGYNVVSGVEATTESINGFDFGATVYGSIEAMATGELDAAGYQKNLVEAWAKLLENLKK